MAFSIKFEGGDGEKNPSLFMNSIPVTFTYNDGTSETIEYQKNTPVILTMDDGSTETITVSELADAFNRAE